MVSSSSTTRRTRRHARVADEPARGYRIQAAAYALAVADAAGEPVVRVRPRVLVAGRRDRGRFAGADLAAAVAEVRERAARRARRPGAVAGRRCPSRRDGPAPIPRTGRDRPGVPSCSDREGAPILCTVHGHRARRRRRARGVARAARPGRAVAVARRHPARPTSTSRSTRRPQRSIVYDRNGNVMTTLFDRGPVAGEALAWCPQVLSTR